MRMPCNFADVGLGTVTWHVVCDALTMALQLLLFFFQATAQPELKEQFS